MPPSPLPKLYFTEKWLLFLESIYLYFWASHIHTFRHMHYPHTWRYHNGTKNLVRKAVNNDRMFKTKTINRMLRYRRCQCGWPPEVLGKSCCSFASKRSQLRWKVSLHHPIQKTLEDYVSQIVSSRIWICNTALKDMMAGMRTPAVAWLHHRCCTGASLCN